MRHCVVQTIVVKSLKAHAMTEQQNPCSSLVARRSSLTFHDHPPGVVDVEQARVLRACPEDIATAQVSVVDRRLSLLVISLHEPRQTPGANAKG